MITRFRVVILKMITPNCEIPSCHFQNDHIGFCNSKGIYYQRTTLILLKTGGPVGASERGNRRLFLEAKRNVEQGGLEGGPRFLHVQNHGIPLGVYLLVQNATEMGCIPWFCGHEKVDPKGRNPHIKFHGFGLSCVDFKAHFQHSHGILSDHVFCRVTNKKNKFIPITRIQNHHARA